MPKAAPSSSYKDRPRPPSGCDASHQAAAPMAASSATAAALPIAAAADGIAAAEPVATAAADPAGGAEFPRALTQVLPHTVPDGLLIGEPTLLPYSVHEPS